MPDILPLFPLSLVVFPGETLKLHIFEPRYQQLIRDCRPGGRNMFGIPPVVEQEMANVATMVEVASVDEQFPTGESNITIKAHNRFHIREFFPVSPGKLYPGGTGKAFPEEEAIHGERILNLQDEILDLMMQLFDALGIMNNVVDAPTEITGFRVGHHVGLSLAQEVELLAMTNELSRLNFIYDHIVNILPVVRETERLKTRAQLNGHYKNVVPPNY